MESSLVYGCMPEVCPRLCCTSDPVLCEKLGLSASDPPLQVCRTEHLIRIMCPTSDTTWFVSTERLDEVEAALRLLRWV